MLARIRLFQFYNFWTIVKERRTKYRRIISQFSRDQLLFIDKSAKRWQDFLGKYQYNQLCKRENILRNICCGPDDDQYFKNTKSFASLQNRQEKFRCRAISGMIDGSRFAWWKNPNSCVKLKMVVSRSEEAQIHSATSATACYYLLKLLVIKLQWGAPNRFSHQCHSLSLLLKTTCN